MGGSAGELSVRWKLNEATLAAIDTQLDAAAIAEAEQGRKLTVREAVAFALDSETERADSVTRGSS